MSKVDDIAGEISMKLAELQTAAYDERNNVRECKLQEQLKAVQDARAELKKEYDDVRDRVRLLYHKYAPEFEIFVGPHVQLDWMDTQLSLLQSKKHEVSKVSRVVHGLLPQVEKLAQAVGVTWPANAFKAATLDDIQMWVNALCDEADNGRVGRTDAGELREEHRQLAKAVDKLLECAGWADAVGRITHDQRVRLVYDILKAILADKQKLAAVKQAMA